MAMLAAGNVAVSSGISFLTALDPWLHSLVQLGQFSVAAATVWYVIRRARSIKIPSKRRRQYRKKKNASSS